MRHLVIRTDRAGKRNGAPSGGHELARRFRRDLSELDR
ncbi:hypothetical protein CO60_0441 [Mycobacterium tuberculosis]|nr:hypothetical protein CO60_0441 [Mycobacterium tuberculosis]